MPPGINPTIPRPTYTPPSVGTVTVPQTGTGVPAANTGVPQTTTPAVTDAGNLPNVGDVRAAAAQQQAAPNVGLFGSIKAGLTAFKNAITRAFSRPPAPPPVTIPPRMTVTILPGMTATLPKEQYEPMIMALPKSERAAAIGNLGTTLTNRIAHGVQVLNQVRGSATPPPASPQNVADMMLALYALAAHQGEAFTNGSFSVPDPDGAIANWLDTSADVYVRSSSHLHAYQRTTVDGHLNLQRGIDIPEGVTTGLPNGHRTVLYGTIPEVPARRGNAPVGRRLFLKTESAGCRINTAGSGDIQRAVNQNVGMRIRDKRLSDVSEFFRHAFSFIATRGQQGVGSARKEHFPSNLATAYKQVTTRLEKQAKAEGQNSSSLRALNQIRDGGPSKGGGVCMLLRNLEDLEDLLPTFPENDRAAIAADIHTLRDAIANMPNPRDLEMRLGNEVILHI